MTRRGTHPLTAQPHPLAGTRGVLLLCASAAQQLYVARHGLSRGIHRGTFAR